MVKTIIFDFGNVLIDLDYPRFNAQLQSLLNFNPKDNPIPASITDILTEYEKGRCTEDDIMSTIHQFRPGVSKAEFQTVWNSLLEGVPSHRIHWLKKLAKQYELVLLSNINNWHRKWEDDHLLKVHGVTSFERTYFSHYFYSYEIGMRKPDNDIYNHVLNSIGRRADEVLFIDDSAANIESAKKLGWNAVIHDAKQDIVEQFPSYIKLL